MESETGQRARRLALGRERVQQAEAGIQKNSVSGPGSWIGAEDGWLSSDMNEFIIVIIHSVRGICACVYLVYILCQLHYYTNTLRAIRLKHSPSN